MNGLWNQILVSRDAFLLESLAPYVDDEILERLQSVSPAQAGVDPRVIARISDRIIAEHADRAAAVALPSALASGVMRAFTLPLEYASYLYESALLVQKLLYLYTGIKEEHMLAHHQLPGYLCIFFGTVFTAKGVSAVSGTLMRMGAAPCPENADVFVRSAGWRSGECRCDPAVRGSAGRGADRSAEGAADRASGVSDHRLRAGQSGDAAVSSERRRCRSLSNFRGNTRRKGKRR